MTDGEWIVTEYATFKADEVVCVDVGDDWDTPPEQDREAPRLAVQAVFRSGNSRRTSAHADLEAANAARDALVAEIKEALG